MDSNLFIKVVFILLVGSINFVLILEVDIILQVVFKVSNNGAFNEEA